MPKLYVHQVEVMARYNRPWVAQVTGACPTYGLQRTFLRPLRDYEHAKVSWKGNLNGVVANFLLYEGCVYEVCAPGKRGDDRKFLRVIDGAPFYLTVDQVVAWLNETQSK